MTQQKILYFRGREKAVQLLLLYSSSSAAHCLAPHTRSLPAPLAHQHSSPRNDSPLYYPFRRKYERMEPIWLKAKRTPSARGEQAAQRADLCWKSAVPDSWHPAGLRSRGAGEKSPGLNIINQLQEESSLSSDIDVYFYITQLTPRLTHKIQRCPHWNESHPVSKEDLHRFC